MGKPLHESLVSVIENAKPEGLKSLAALIVATNIPKNHVAISEAWQIRVSELELRPDVYGNIPQVLVEKAEEARQAHPKNQEVTTH